MNRSERTRVPDCVLDASAVLAVIRGESGAEMVEVQLARALISAVNFAEVISRLSDLGVPNAVAVSSVMELGAEVAIFDDLAAVSVGALRVKTRIRGLSLGDRACLALALSAGLPALTADRVWAELDLGVEVVLIR